MGFGGLTGGGEHEVDRSVGRLRGVTGKGWEDTMKSRLAGAWSPVWELGRVRLDRSLGPSRDGMSVCWQCEGFQMMVRVRGVMDWSLAPSHWHQQ